MFDSAFIHKQKKNNGRKRKTYGILVMQKRRKLNKTKDKSMDTLGKNITKANNKSMNNNTSNAYASS